MTCRPGYINCGDGSCVRERFACDGYNDCANGADEQGCYWTLCRTTPNGYACDNGEQFLPRCMECRRGLAMRKLSVRPSVKRVNCDKTEERFLQISIPYERSFSLVFWEEWLVRATPFTWIFGSTGPRWSEIADFQPIFASAVTPSEKSSINTNRKSTTRFPMSLRRSSYVAAKKGGSKTQNSRFPSKIALRLKEVCYKVSLCENCQR